MVDQGPEVSLDMRILRGEALDQDFGETKIQIGYHNDVSKGDRMANQVSIGGKVSVQGSQTSFQGSNSILLGLGLR